ncbi:MAG: hypothetical protein M5U26_10415 [Planctomycetota bacterium]|nr:hypothetical protein [Planctomycetota bacterium]
MPLSEKETATILAALRLWQRRVVEPASRSSQPNQVIASAAPDYFTEHTPLDATEIDALCERLNLDEALTIHLVVADRPEDTIAGRFYEAYMDRADAEVVLQKIKEEQPDWDADMIDLDLLG